MPRIRVSLGSNIEREAHIRAAVTELERHLGPARISPVYETDAEGFEGPAFYNLVIALMVFPLVTRLLGARRRLGWSA